MGWGDTRGKWKKGGGRDCDCRDGRAKDDMPARRSS